MGIIGLGLQRGVSEESVRACGNAVLDWDHCQVAWRGAGIREQEIIQGSFLSPYEPVNAFGPIPADGAADVKRTLMFRWQPGKYPVSHEVYLGTDQEAVRNASASSPEYKGTKPKGTESCDPGTLELETTYHWRIDEVNSVNLASPWIGEVWSFTIGDFLVVDDFESYNDIDPPDPESHRMFETWIDGFGTTTNGALVGNELPPYAEQTIVHSGKQSMPFRYDNNMKYSQAERAFSVSDRDWTAEGVKTLSLWHRGYPASVDSFTEGPVGTYTITTSGTDIAGESDEFHFAHKILSGPGSITAKVLSVSNTDPWAKAGVMIRETLEPGSKHAFACVTPGSGVASEGRITTNGVSHSTAQSAITAPHWVKLERDLGGNFTVAHSANGTTWTPVEGTLSRAIQMSAASVYIGLAVTAHNAGATCEAAFSNVSMTGTISQQQWMNQDIGITSNDPEPMYVVLNGSAVVYHEDPQASVIDQWTGWRIDLKEFADQGVNLTNIDSIAIGVGTKGNTTAPGGFGTVCFDDIRLYRPGEATGQ